MLKYARLEMNQSQYDELQLTQRKNKNTLREQFIGSRKKLFAEGNMIATVNLNDSLSFGSITKNQFNAFLGAFNKQLYKQFATNPSLFGLSIDFSGASREKNYDAWECLNEGDYFYNIDLSAAYWQVAHKLGYLNDKMFQTYFELDEYKMAKRLCISFLARQNFMIYYTEDGKYQIDCETSVFKTVYQNIRHYLYQTITNALTSNISWLEYNIDGVTVTEKSVDDIKSYFNSFGLKYKVTECKKLNDKQYLYGNVERRFRNK